METTHHLVSACRYTRRVWRLIADWVGLRDFKPAEWPHNESTLHWWKNIAFILDIPRKAAHSIMLLTVWMIWKERNARAFHHAEASALSTVAKIKSEASAWVAAGAKDLEVLLART
jgi:hypothetical protein